MSPVIKILIAFLLCVATTIALRFLLGKKRDIYFRKSTPKSFITLSFRLSSYQGRILNFFGFSFGVNRRDFFGSFFILDT